MSHPRTRTEPRQEIQALRAVAVLLVIGYHFWPGALRAGFIGVDVFFVISGYLISAQLLRELRSAGRISFGSFYARRARRILPAALIVLAVCVLATFALSSAAFWSNQLRHIIASVFFFENWALAAQSVDYLGATTAATPVQHYWSLSVEEQFYLVWPALLVGVYWLCGRLAPARRLLAMTLALALVTALSLTFSIVAALTDPVPAFFNTGARVWEFGIGALLACVGAAVTQRRSARLAAALLGWALIAASALLLDSETPFPGVAALAPVVGTALVIWAGVPTGTPLLARVLDNRVVRGLAELSFAAYLWHWPLVVFARQVYGDDLPHALRLLLVVLTFALALATNAVVERPVRFGRLSQRRARSTAVLAAVLALAVAVPAGVGLAVFERTVATQAAAVAAPDSALCVGAEARDPQRDCVDGPYASLIPNPLLPYEEVSVLHGMGCALDLRDAGVASCEFGDLQSDISVALVGDSHAMKMWRPLKKMAEENGWHLVTFLRAGCMYSLGPHKADSCEQWRADVAERLHDEGPWDLVFTATADGAGDDADAAVRGLHQAWKPLTDAGAEVVVIRDNPKLPESPVKCIVANLDDVTRCDVPRSKVSFADIQADAARGQTGVSVVDLTPFYCDESTCAVSAGGILLYRDAGHLNDDYAVTLAPYIADQVAEFAPEYFDPPR